MEDRDSNESVERDESGTPAQRDERRADSPGGEEGTLDSTGAYDWEELVDESVEPPPEEYANPSGIGRGSCDEDGDEGAECDLEVTAEVDDLFLEETKPGIGIQGFEGEESGGG